MAVNPTIVSTVGIDDVLLDAPPLVAPPLSLLDLSTELVDLEGLTAAQTDALEKQMSAQARASDIAARMAGRSQDAQTLAELSDQYEKASAEVDLWQQDALDKAKRLAPFQRWEYGFRYLPELSHAAGISTWAPDTRVNEANQTLGGTATKVTGLNQTPTAWYDPFVVIGRDSRSTMGYSASTDLKARAERALRALRAYESDDCEYEFWTGKTEPTNFHLSASPNTVTTSPHRTITAWSNPDPAAGTTLGVAVGLGQALAALDQSIATAKAGVGSIHATPFLVQRWSSVYQFVPDRASGRTYTVNGNLIVPGYGYPATGPDPGPRTVTDGATNSGSLTVTSATAVFTTFDYGVTVSGPGIPAGAYIVGVTSPTAAVLNVAATATATGVTLVIGAGIGSLAEQRYQWAYATERTYYMKGDARTLPWDIRQASPSVPSFNTLDVRAERSWAILTNRLLRAAVLVDTQTP